MSEEKGYEKRVESSCMPKIYLLKWSNIVKESSKLMAKIRKTGMKFIYTLSFHPS